MLDIFALFVLFVLVVLICVLTFLLGALPGKIARKRDHPQADAINVCGWLGLLTLGLLWPIALIWAYLQPAVAGKDVHERLAALEEKIDRLTPAQGGSR